jgi:hypothetical protein
LSIRAVYQLLRKDIEGMCKVSGNPQQLSGCPLLDPNRVRKPRELGHGVSYLSGAPGGACQVSILTVRWGEVPRAYRRKRARSVAAKSSPVARIGLPRDPARAYTAQSPKLSCARPLGTVRGRFGAVNSTKSGVLRQKLTDRVQVLVAAVKVVPSAR